MKKTILISMILFLLGTGMQAQVKIGSNNAPASGALLDLNGTYKGGLLLPNVAITDLGLIPAGFTERGGEDSALDLAGMIVWSTDPVNLGLYIWDGEDWQALSGGVMPCSGPAPAPTAINIPAGPFANGETFDVSCTATEDGTTFFVWTAPSGLSITGDQGTKTITVLGTQGTYNKSGFTVFAVNQCGQSATADGGAGEITVNAALSTTVPPSIDIEILPGDNTGLDGGTVSGGNCADYSYQWQVFNSPDWENIPGATTAVYQTPALTADTKYRRITTCGNETVTSDEITVIIKQIAEPDNVTATELAITCGDATSLSYTGGTGSTFVWYTGSCGGTQVGTGNNFSDSPTETTTYYGRWEKDGSASGCKTVTVTVDKIAPSVTITGNPSVETNTDVTFTATNSENVPDVTYSWTAPDGNPSSGTGNTFTTRWSSTGNKSVSVTMTTSSVCYNPASESRETTVTAPAPVYSWSEMCAYINKSACTCTSGTGHTYGSLSAAAKAWADANYGLPVWNNKNNGDMNATPTMAGVPAGPTDSAWLLCY